MSILSQPLWRDYSRWQGQVDFDVAVDNGVLGMAARAGISWGYQDSWFPRNWKEAGRVGFYRTSYHIVVPGENKMDQIDNWYSVHPELDTIPRVMDVEVNWNDLAPERISYIIWDLSEEIKRRDGVRPWIYMGLYKLNHWIVPYWSEDQLNAHFWWLAQYDTDPAKEQDGVHIPEGIRTENVILKQTADKKPPFEGEVESTFVDWDRWLLGDEAHMHKWIKDFYGAEYIYTQEDMDKAMEAARQKCDRRVEVERERLRDDIIKAIKAI